MTSICKAQLDWDRFRWAGASAAGGSFWAQLVWGFVQWWYGIEGVLLFYYVTVLLCGMGIMSSSRGCFRGWERRGRGVCGSAEGFRVRRAVWDGGGEVATTWGTVR